MIHSPKAAFPRPPLPPHALDVLDRRAEKPTRFFRAPGPGVICILHQIPAFCKFAAPQRPFLSGFPSFFLPLFSKFPKTSSFFGMNLFRIQSRLCAFQTKLLRVSFFLRLKYGKIVNKLKTDPISAGVSAIFPPQRTALRASFSKKQKIRPKPYLIESIELCDPKAEAVFSGSPPAARAPQQRKLFAISPFAMRRDLRLFSGPFSYMLPSSASC